MNNEDLRMYAVYDTEGELYDVPFFSPSDLFARRKFIMDCKNRAQQTMINSFKDAFELKFIGIFNKKLGEFYNEEPIVIIKGKEVTIDEINNAT